MEKGVITVEVIDREATVKEDYKYTNKPEKVPENTVFPVMGMIGFMREGNIIDCEVDACCVYDEMAGYNNGYAVCLIDVKAVAVFFKCIAES